jgi:carboxylesterase
VPSPIEAGECAGSGGPAEPVDVSPFDLPGRGGAVHGAAALCLHGFTGTPYEVRPLGEALAARGVRAVGPALPGHNETPFRLAAVSHDDWLEAARSELARLRARHDPVFAVGLSMGGLLALSLAAEGLLDGLVVIATPLRLWGPLPWLVPLLKHVAPFARKRTGADIRDPVARRRHPSYDRMPLQGVHELIRLQRWVRPRLGRVRCPILVAHGAHDVTANPADAREILGKVSSPRRELLILEGSAHNVAVDYDGPRLAREAADFLLGALTGPSHGS